MTPVDIDFTENLVPVTMSFPDAIRRVINGERITRISWGNDDYGLLKDGWLTIFTKGEFHTWSINDGDLEGEDWVILPILD